MANDTRYGLLAGWIVILLAAGLYLATLDTGLRPDELSGGDLITHQYAQVQARPGKPQRRESERSARCAGTRS